MKKLLLILILILLIYILTGYCATYTSQYPTQDTDHVKATSFYSNEHYPHFTTDPTSSLTGIPNFNQWFANFAPGTPDQRFHIDLGSGKVIRRIYYENAHTSGASTAESVKDFTFWGSDSAGSFAELTYGTDTGWTELTVATNVMLEHVEADEADPQYILVTNSIAYRYYAFKCATTNTSGTWAGIRRIELQTEDGWTPPTGITWNGVVITKWNGVAITIPINTQ